MGVPWVRASVYREHLPALGWCPLAFKLSATSQKVWERLSGGVTAHLARKTRAHSWWELAGNFPVKLALLGNVESGMYSPGGMSGQNQRQETHHRTGRLVMQQCGRIPLTSVLCTASSLLSSVGVLNHKTPEYSVPLLKPSWSSCSNLYQQVRSLQPNAICASQLLTALLSSLCFCWPKPHTGKRLVKSIKFVKTSERPETVYLNRNI